MKGIYKFYWDYGRNGEVSGVFVAEDTEVEEIIGNEVYFGEILGKHSEVYGTVTSEDITLISDNPEFVKMFKEHIGTIGYNPITRYAETNFNNE